MFRLTSQVFRMSMTDFSISVQSVRAISATPTLGFRDPKVKPRWTFVSGRSHRWEEIPSLREKYGDTTEPVPLPRTGGRGPNGRIWQYRVGGGFRKYVRMVDWIRGGPSCGEPLKERVVEFAGDDVKTAKLALVAQGERKRWIIATENMQVGDIIKSTTDTNISSMKGWKDGDSMPLKCIPRGTNICCVQKYVGHDSRTVTVGGSQGMLVRHVADQAVVKLPSGHEMMVSNQCAAVIGKPVRYKPKQKMRKAGEARWLGRRPQSGLWHAKDGRFGRKTNRRKKLKEFSKAPQKQLKPKRILFEGGYNFG